MHLSLALERKQQQNLALHNISHLRCAIDRKLILKFEELCGADTEHLEVLHSGCDVLLIVAVLVRLCITLFLLLTRHHTSETLQLLNTHSNLNVVVIYY